MSHDKYPRMQLNISPLDAPIGDSHWSSTMSSAYAIKPDCNTDALIAYYKRTWNWARETTKVARAFATSASDPVLIAEALRIAARHDGVWRAANKMVKKDASSGKEVRSAVAVRSDAGDSTCPTYLEREGYRRAQTMWPIVAACKELGYSICTARSPSITRSRAAEALSYIADKNFRTMHGIIGMDVLTIPESSTHVHFEVIAAFEPNFEHAITMPIDFVFAPIIDIERVYQEPACAATALKPAEWFLAQMSRMVDGRRQRDRHTYGCFYGEAGSKLITRAAEIRTTMLDGATRVVLAGIESNIALALGLVNEACSAGDLHAAQSAWRFAKAYVDDAKTTVIGEHSLILSALYIRVNSVSFHGLTDSPILQSLHDAFMNRIHLLPLPMARVVPQWQCVEHVAIRGMSDIVDLAKWVKEGKSVES